MGILRRIYWWIWNLFFPRKKPFLSYWIKSKAERNLNKRIWQFKQKHHGREPNKYELRWLVVNASHMTEKRRNDRGHWKRQKIRKVLLEERGIHYKMK